MARIAGDREKEIEVSADISAMGSEGALTFKTEIWTIAQATTIAAIDTLESDQLTIPGGSKILSIEIIRSWTAQMDLQYRDVRPGLAAGFGTWTTLVDETTPSANELVAGRNHAEMLKTLTYTRQFRLQMNAVHTAPAGGSTVKALIQFGNI